MKKREGWEGLDTKPLQFFDINLGFKRVNDFWMSKIKEEGPMLCIKHWKRQKIKEKGTIMYLINIKKMKEGSHVYIREEPLDSTSRLLGSIWQIISIMMIMVTISLQTEKCEYDEHDQDSIDVFPSSDRWLNPEQLLGVLKRSLILFVCQPDILVLWKPFLKADASRAVQMGIFARGRNFYQETWN